MSDELTDLLAHVGADLPHRHAAGAEPVTISADSLPRPPTTLSTDRFWMRRVGFHLYDGFPVPAVDLCIDKPGCRDLGLLILAVLFHPEPVTVEVQLAHPASEVKNLRIRHQHPGPDGRGLSQVPAQFRYLPEEVHRHPWVRGRTWQEPHPSCLPRLEITTADEGFLKWEPSQMDTVIGFGNADGAALLAELLLNASLDDNEADEFNLEGEPGYRGVATGSAELNIYLSGNLGHIG